MSRMPMPENVPEVAPEPLLTIPTRDGEGRDCAEEAVVIAPVRKDEPIVTRKVRDCSCLRMLDIEMPLCTRNCGVITVRCVHLRCAESC